MKELSTEEKAKRYDEAIKKAKDMLSYKEVRREDMEYLFPELKEDEDEKIRKALIKYYSFNKDGGSHALDNITPKQIVTWLEKQGKNNMGISESVKQKLEDNLSKALEKETSESWNEFLNEQKSTDKTEPKFKVGDTVTVKPMSCHGKVFKGEPFRIVDIIEDNYISDDGKTYSISLQDGWELAEQKSAWSEEDERILNTVIHDLRFPGVNYYKKPIEEKVKWLKSLKDRYTWKPSDEQMEALEKECMAHSNYELCRLLEQLKKL